MNKYEGMTVNERLYISGLLNDFDEAVQEKNVDKIVLILKKIELTDLSINPILEYLGLERKE